MECARSQFFGEPEFLVDVLARCLGAVAEMCVRKVLVREEKIHSLSIVTDGGVAACNCDAPSWFAKWVKFSKLVSSSLRVRVLNATFQILGGSIFRIDAPR